MVETVPERVATPKNAYKRAPCPTKHFMSRGGAAPPPLALAEIATPLSSCAQFAANHLHFTDGLWDRVLVCMHFYGSPPSREQFPQLGNSFLTALY